MSADRTHEYSVSLDIASGSVTLAELGRVLAVEGGAGSHERGDPHPVRGPLPGALLRIASSAAPGEGLALHLRSITESFPPERLAALARYGGEVTWSFRVGVFFETATCTVPIDAGSLEILGRYGGAVEIVAYPCE